MGPLQFLRSHVAENFADERLMRRIFWFSCLCGLSALLFLAFAGNLFLKSAPGKNNGEKMVDGDGVSPFSRNLSGYLRSSDNNVKWEKSVTSPKGKDVAGHFFRFRRSVLDGGPIVSYEDYFRFWPFRHTRFRTPYWLRTPRGHLPPPPVQIRHRAFGRMRPSSSAAIISVGDGDGDGTSTNTSSFFHDVRSTPDRGGKRLTEACRHPAIEEFPRDFMTPRQRIRGGVLAHAGICGYVLLMVAIVCNDYFVPALEEITAALSLSPDVAGATFMAAGSSAPEFFTNIVGTFITEGDLGVGTIVGSAVFNVLGVTAVIGLVAGSQNIPVDFWALTRDTLFYLLSVILLIVVMLDGVITLKEAIFFVTPYLVYILVMKFDKRINTAFRRRMRGKRFGDRLAENRKAVRCALKAGQKAVPEKTDEGGYWDVLTRPPKGILKKLLWVLSWPAILLLRLTMPDCSRARWRKWFPLTFIVSIFWIAGLTYIVAWMITIIGHTLRIPDSVMGLTFLAAGTSVPELASSVLVAKKGMGTMSVSNLLGSNTFDILICLGLPWLIKGAVSGRVLIESSGLTYSAGALLSTVVLMYLVFAGSGFYLDRRVGVSCLVLYALFLVVAMLTELNVFGVFNLPPCPTDA